ncbi:hypothetical protein Poli38472_013724 [Pythium oligandrum]|uniref:Uncharacterized protein n=1 Tax=Pythium oligandrum TaxID=41045 RepID=A0A8K1FG50_PYTOL|nr:hypothetical protein Poli38472_013724 [Pythium oligandrum]|eukprot:TMW61261.1 hypothetical protein Poli38472_013724 [Pythium oligandrum]
MRELSLDFEEVRNPTTDEMLEAFLLVLEMNDRLLYLTLTVTDTQYDRFNERFLVFNGQYMRWKLPIQAKCAFLSVVKHAQRANAKTSGTKCRAVGNLDSLALSIILFMASERHLRSVILDSLTEQGGVDFCEQLRALELPLTPDEGDEDEEATWFRHCEAVELLLLASLVDPKGFTEMVWGHCANKEEIPRECFGYNPVMPCRLRLVISTFNDIERVFAKTKTLLTPRSTHSDKFNTTLTTLLRMGEEKQLDLEEAVIPVTIALSFLDERHANHLLSLLVEYQRTKNTHSDHLKDCRFVMDDVELDISGVSISGGLIDVVELFKSTPGLRFRTINLPLFQPHYDLTAAIYERRRIPWR